MKTALFFLIVSFGSFQFLPTEMGLVIMIASISYLLTTKITGV